eukprot:6468870-Amphidinium_carterae.1
MELWHGSDRVPDCGSVGGTTDSTLTHFFALFDVALHYPSKVYANVCWGWWTLIRLLAFRSNCSESQHTAPSWTHHPQLLSSDVAIPKPQNLINEQ